MKKYSFKFISLLLCILLTGCSLPVYKPFDTNQFMKSVYGTPTELQVTYLVPEYPKDKVTPIQKIFIRAVDSDSPADKAGLKAGDEILSINKQTFSVYEKFSKYLHNARGLEKEIRLLRNENGAVFEKTVKLKAQAVDVGIWLKYADDKGNAIHPVNREGSSIGQMKDKAYLQAIFYSQGSLMVSIFKIYNLSGGKINFDQKDFLFKGGDNELLLPISNQMAMAAQYSDKLSQSLLAGMQAYPAMAAIGTQKEEQGVVTIPDKTFLTKEFYFKLNSPSYPIEVNASIADEKYRFKFTLPQLVKD